MGADPTQPCHSHSKNVARVWGQKPHTPWKDEHKE